MHRGSTPYIRFSVDRDLSELTALNIVLTQDGNIIIEKGINDVYITGKDIDVYLSENETLKFKTDKFNNAYIEAQLKFGFGQERVISDIYSLIIKPIIKDGVLDDQSQPLATEPTIGTDGANITAEHIQRPGYVESPITTSTTKPAKELDPNIKAENIRDGVTIFGQLGNWRGIPKLQDKDVVDFVGDGQSLFLPEETYVADPEFDGLAYVHVQAALLQQNKIDKPGVYTRKTHDAEHIGSLGTGPDAELEIDIPVQEKTHTLTKEEADAGTAVIAPDVIPGNENGRKYEGMTQVNVDIPLQEVPTITENGTVEAEPGFIGFKSPINVKMGMNMDPLFDSSKELYDLTINAKNAKNNVSMKGNGFGSRLKFNNFTYNYDGKEIAKIDYLMSYASINNLKINFSIADKFYFGYYTKITNGLINIQELNLKNNHDILRSFEIADNGTVIVKIKKFTPNQYGYGTIFTTDPNSANEMGKNSILVIDNEEKINIQNIATVNIRNNTFTIDIVGELETANIQDIPSYPPIFNLVMRSKTINSLTKVNQVQVVSNIYVPDELVEQYKVASNWVVFADKIKPLSTLPPENDYTKRAL